MTPNPARVSGRLWLWIVLLGLTGQLAWTVENMYLNVFVYETITDDPTVIAVLVAASATAATLATLLVGAWSDRVGHRRRFIAVGYVLWGLTTAAFGLVGVDSSVPNAVGVAVVSELLDYRAARGDPLSRLGADLDSCVVPRDGDDVVPREGAVAERDGECVVNHASITPHRRRGVEAPPPTTVRDAGQCGWIHSFTARPTVASVQA